MRIGRGWPSAIGALALLATLVVPAPRAVAAGETLQVSREVSTALGGDAVALTARISAAATGGGVKVNFTAVDGPGKTSGATTGSCTVPAGEDTCQIAFNATQRGTSQIRAWIDGTTPDTAELRLANSRTDPLGLDPGADCRPEDDPLLENTCAPDGTPVGEGAPEPDATDMVQITWTSFADARLDCDDGKPSDGEDVEYNNSAANDRTETYRCLLTTLDDPPAPIANARIDGEKLGGLDDIDGRNAGSPDIDNACVTGSDGRCSFAVTIPAPSTGSTTICFWAEPGDPDVPGDNTFDEQTGPAIDGGGCDDEPVDEPESNDITDAVLLDVDVPRATRLDAAPEDQAASPGSRFTFSSGVYDQFGQGFPGDTEVRVELFENSPLDSDGNDPSTPDFKCQTGTQGRCTVSTPPQIVLGVNLACVWFKSSEPAPTMIGDNLGGSCGDEGATDATADDGLPEPVTDRVDVIRFAIQSRPGIFTIQPTELRQDTSDILRLSGVNFLQGARIGVSGSGLSVGVTRYGSETAVEADIAVAVDAPAGPRDVTVTNPDGGTTTCAGCFRVVGQGYWMVASDGGIFAFGDSRFAGSAGDKALNQPIVGMAPTPSGEGYWLVASDGGIFNFGDAPFLGSAGNLALNRPIVGIAASPTGRGYWLVASDGGIFSFGDARFFGSTGRLPLKQPIVGIAASPTGRGYWLVASDGGVFAFGEARFFGSAGDLRLNQPIVALAPSGTGRGYWLVGSDGGIFAYGDARFHGGTGDIPLNKPIVGMVTTPFVQGYWLVASDGGIFAFGDARFFGSTGAITLNQPIVGIARR